MAKGKSYYDKQAKSYTDEYTKQLAKIKANAEQAKSTADKDLTDTQRQAYISRMQQQKELPNQLRQMGIVGGGSETTMLGAETNYQNQRAYNDRTAANRKGEIDRGYFDSESALTLSHNENMRQLNSERQAEEVSTYKATLSRFGSEAAINKEIKRLKASGRYDLLPYAQLQRQAILDNNKSSSGSSGRSSGRSSGSSSRSSTVSSTKPSSKPKTAWGKFVANLQKAVKANKGNTRRSKPRSKPRFHKPKQLYGRNVRHGR